MELGTMFGMILVEFIILNVITHSLTRGLHYPGHHHSLRASKHFFNVLSFFHSPVAAVGAAAKVGRVSVESGVDWATFYSKFQMTLLAADAYELKTLECAVLNSRITKRYLKL